VTTKSLFCSFFFFFFFFNLYLDFPCQVPYYKDHGYLLESEICAVLEHLDQELFDNIYTGQDNHFEELQHFISTCRGSHHTHELHPLRELLSKTKKSADDDDDDDDDDTMKNSHKKKNIMFAKLSPNNVPSSLSIKLQPDGEFVLPQGREVKEETNKSI
jgi:hypothetical protein